MVRSPLLFILCALSGLTQTSDKSSVASSLQISRKEVIADNNGVAKLALTIENTSNKPVVAYVIKMVILDSSNKAQGTSCQLSFRGGAKAWAPDEQLNEILGLPYGSQASAHYESSIDYVLYQDNSVYGPNSCHEADHIQSLRTATHAERQRLRQIRDAKGIQAMLADLDEK